MENDFDLDVFLENLAEEQLFKSVSPKHQEQELELKRQLDDLGKQRATEQQQHSGARPNPIVPEFPQPWPYGDPPSRAMKKPVDEKGYPFVSQADAARILGIDRKAAIFSGNGVIKVEREKISGATKSPRIWIRLTDLKKSLQDRIEALIAGSDYLKKRTGREITPPEIETPDEEESLDEGLDGYEMRRMQFYAGIIK
jgi:hypothetical protein